VTKCTKEEAKLKNGELPALHRASPGEGVQDQVPRLCYPAMCGQLLTGGLPAACSSPSVPPPGAFLGGTALPSTTNPNTICLVLIPHTLLQGERGCHRSPLGMATSFPVFARLPHAEKGPSTAAGKASPFRCLWSILKPLSILGTLLNRAIPSGWT